MRDLFPVTEKDKNHPGRFCIGRLPEYRTANWPPEWHGKTPKTVRALEEIKGWAPSGERRLARKQLVDVSVNSDGCLCLYVLSAPPLFAQAKQVKVETFWEDVV